MQEYLKPTEYFDFNTDAVLRFISYHAVGSDPIDKLKQLYLAIRDEIRYNPYVFSSDPKTFKASYVVTEKVSYCIPKAVLLGAVARAIGIPSRLGLADVRNHLASPQLIEWLKTDYFAMHGYIELYINQKWIKATPAFNKSLCQKMNISPLSFDGTQDAIFQEFTNDGLKHMEYLKYHGEFSDVPRELILKVFAQTYPHLVSQLSTNKFIEFSLEKDLKK